MSQVILFSPNRYSLYSSAVASLLLRSQVRLLSIVVRSLLNPRRLADEYRRDGSRLLRKIWRKLLLRETAYSRAGSENLAEYRRRLGIQEKDVYDFRSKYGIPVIPCKTLNDLQVVEHLHCSQPDLVIFTGGGLIRRQTLEQAGAGILNCHMGLLPHYRGMDVVEWPILEGKQEAIGISVHFMDQGVDTGDLLCTRRVPIQPGEDIRRLRERIEPLMVEEIVHACTDYLEGRLPRKPQNPAAGRQYFIMHPQLLQIAERKLAATHEHPHG